MPCYWGAYKRDPNSENCTCRASGAEFRRSHSDKPGEVIGAQWVEVKHIQDCAIEVGVRCRVWGSGFRV